MRNVLMLAGFALAGAALLPSNPAAATPIAIYNNLDSANSGADPVSNSGFGPLADSFSNQGASSLLTSVGVKLETTDSTDGDSVTVSLLSDNATSPGTTLYTLGTIADSALTNNLVDYFFDPAMSIVLAANTRYWLQLSSVGSALLGWSMDQTAPGVVGEFLYDSGGVYANASGSYQMRILVSAIPLTTVDEPGGFWLVAAGLLAGLWFARKRKLQFG